MELMTRVYKTMKISVIVPTYNPQAYLFICLDSIFHQTFPKSDYELLLILNGCNEPYNAQINEWLSKHEELQVQYFQTDDAGVSNARNIGIDNAKGEFVAFIDDDDLVSPSYLEELYYKAIPHSVSLCYPYAFNDGDIQRQLPNQITDAYDYCCRHNCKRLSSMARKFFSGPCMKLIPMSFIQDRRFDVRFKNGEDSLFMFLISDKINSVGLTSKTAVYYRRYRKGSAIGQQRRFKTIVTTQLLIVIEYFKIYFNNLRKYNFFFFFTRVVGAIYCILIRK